MKKLIAFCAWTVALTPDAKNAIEAITSALRMPDAPFMARDLD
jgi:hypothetical protein